MLILGHICEIYFNITAGKLGGPFLTRAEVLKSGQCHWFKITATERDLGYKSYMDSKTGFANMAKWFAERDPDLKRKRSFAERWSGMILIGGFIVSILALSLIFVSLGGR